MKLVDITVIDTDDWIGVYADGRLLISDHPFYVTQFERIFEALKRDFGPEVGIKSFVSTCDIDLDAMGYVFPDYINDVIML